MATPPAPAPAPADSKGDAGKLADITLANGHVVKDRWRVLEKLGEGGFGAVYKVIDETTKGEYAMKVESKKEEDSMVKIEGIVLKLMARRKLQQHVCQFYDEGETSIFRYLVMQLLGRSLSELRKSCPAGRLSLSTTVRLGTQCLDAIEMLHKVGFLHRDVKPSNFAMGRNESDKKNVYMLDFGLCRQYIAPDGQLRQQRKSAGFRGTVRYASINAHLRKELGRHDDLWSLYYMLIELRTGDLPWRKLTDKSAVGKKKQEISPEQLLYRLPDPEFKRMHETLQALRYVDTPNYVWFHLQLKSIALRNRFVDDQPFDWEPGGEAYESGCMVPPKKRKKRKVKKREDGEGPSERVMEEPKK